MRILLVCDCFADGGQKQLLPMAAVLLSAAERDYIAQGFEQNIRSDGRQREDYRPIEVQLGLIAQASGSARLKLGNTDVIVGVKVHLINTL